jgi:hypothetical protein
MKSFDMRNLGKLVATALIGAGLSVSAWANIPVGPQVSGQVTGVNGPAAVTVDGTTYVIDSSSPAYRTIQSVHVGDHVGLILSGPAGASTSEVVGIVLGSSDSPASGSR